MQIAQLEKGRIPPQSIDLEEAVISALLIDTQAIFVVLPIIKNADVFYKQEHSAIFTAVLALVDLNKPVDLLTVADQLKKLKKLDLVGGEYFLATLMQKVSSTAHLESHCYIVKQQYIKRQLISISATIIASAYDESTDALEVLGTAQIEIDAINQQLLSNEIKDWPSILVETTKQIEKLSAAEQEITGVPTGLHKLDITTGGWQGGQLIILAARPGMGKTALMIKHVSAALNNNIPAAVFSLEMSEKDIAKRLIVIESVDLHANQLFQLGLTKQEYWEQYFKTVAKVETLPIHVQSKPGLSVQDLVIKARELKHRYNIGLIVVDYLQLMTVSGNSRINNREQEISTISRKLKALALELDLPVIALSQLSREVDKRTNKRPRLADLRESGAIEQDADIVSFLYRPEYYDLPEWEDGTAAHNEAEVIIEKHRNGSLVDARIGFNGNRVLFHNIEDEQPAPLNEAF